MKKLRLRMLVAFIAAAFMLSSLPSLAQTTGEARIIYAYMTLLGKKPDSKDLAKWNSRNFRNFGEAFNAIKGELNVNPYPNAKNNPNDLEKYYNDPSSYAKKIMIMKCYRDALAYNPSVDEVKHWLVRTDSYSSLFDNHMAYANNIYDAVINNSHRNTVYRDATPQEMAYWKGKSQSGKIPAYLMEAYIKSKQKKGGGYKLQGLFDPLGDLFAGLINFFVVPADVKAEAVQTGMDPANAAGNFHASMVAAGAGNIITHDGASMVAAGAGNMVAAGAGN